MDHFFSIPFSQGGSYQKTNQEMVGISLVDRAAQSLQSFYKKTLLDLIRPNDANVRS
jgi:hypothetical protein